MAQPGLLSLVLAVGCAMDRTPAADDAPAPYDGGVPGSSDTCGHPSTITYTTDPLPAGSTGCTGNPSTYLFPAVPNPSAVYPNGSRITFPWCLEYYPNEPAVCICMVDRWVCPV